MPQPADPVDGILVYNITKRSLESGTIRLRDRQTLVLTGVIQDKDRETVTKWPILGDLPFLGHYSEKQPFAEKNELVILVTPSIVDDNQGGLMAMAIAPPPERHGSCSAPVDLKAQGRHE